MCNTSVSFFIRLTVVVFILWTINFQEASSSKSLLKSCSASWHRIAWVELSQQLRRCGEKSVGSLQSLLTKICTAEVSLVVLFAQITNSFVKPYCYHLSLFSDLSPRSLLLYLPLNLSSSAIVIRGILQQNQKNPMSTRL